MGVLMSSNFRNILFWVALLIIIVTGYFFVGILFDWSDFGVKIGEYRLNHWLGWIGFAFILIHIPLFETLKARYVNKIKTLLGIHVLGDLLAFLLITIHFASQISRPAAYYPDLGTGIALYAFMVMLVTTGFFQRFNLLCNSNNTWNFLHKSSVVALFVIILIHILQGIKII